MPGYDSTLAALSNKRYWYQWFCPCYLARYHPSFRHFSCEMTDCCWHFRSFTLNTVIKIICMNCWLFFLQSIWSSWHVVALCPQTALVSIVIIWNNSQDPTSNKLEFSHNTLSLWVIISGIGMVQSRSPYFVIQHIMAEVQNDSSHINASQTCFCPIATQLHDRTIWPIMNPENGSFFWCSYMRRPTCSHPRSSLTDILSCI